LAVEGTRAGWSQFSHGSDIGIESYGPTLASVFEQAALGLTAAITEKTITPRTEIEIACHGSDKELLFVDWLNTIIYYMSTERMLFGRFKVRFHENGLTASLWGEPIDRELHQPACEPKAATYTELLVKQTPEGSWTARCIVDV
jgi:SHS2 domain-containing protein